MDFSRLSFNVVAVSVSLLSFNFFQSNSCYADTALQAVQSALNARSQSITNISGNQFGSVSQWTLNLLVNESVEAFRAVGDTQTAVEVSSDWQINYADALDQTILYSNGSGMHILDLGDHKPLLQFLANLFDKLEDRVGSSILYSGIIGDIYQMNYALPIVFTPKGSWRTNVTPNRDWVEYRKHFIPFANIITYYAANIACNKIIAQQNMGNQGKKLCTKISEKLRFAMGRYVAPKVSDFIFNKANGVKAELNISSSDLVYTDAALLLNEVQNEIKNENGGNL